MRKGRRGWPRQSVLGERAEHQTQQRLKQVPQVLEPQRAASELAVFMLDGWQVRYRGPGWGKSSRGKAGETIREQKNYFANQAHRLNYQKIAQRGWPIGSGAVESACAGKQGRFKTRGQFWTQRGIGNLEALIEARENKHWDELWFAA